MEEREKKEEEEEDKGKRKREKKKVPGREYGSFREIKWKIQNIFRK